MLNLVVATALSIFLASQGMRKHAMVASEEKVDRMPATESPITFRKGDQVMVPRAAIVGKINKVIGGTVLIYDFHGVAVKEIDGDSEEFRIHWFHSWDIKKIDSVPPDWCDAMCEPFSHDCIKHAPYCQGCGFCSRTNWALPLNPITVNRLVNVPNQYLALDLGAHDLIFEPPAGADIGIGVRIIDFPDCNARDRLKLLDATRILVEVLNSKSFAAIFLTKTLSETAPSANGLKLTGEGSWMAVTSGVDEKEGQMTNAQILEYMKSGSNLYKTAAANRSSRRMLGFPTLAIHLKVAEFARSTGAGSDNEESTIGYTYPESLHSYLNKDFLASHSAEFIAGNLAHEYMHNLGFHHKNGTATSVPYVVGDVVRQVGSCLVGNPPFVEGDEVEAQGRVGKILFASEILNNYVVQIPDGSQIPANWWDKASENYLRRDEVRHVREVPIACEGIEWDTRFEAPRNLGPKENDCLSTWSDWGHCRVSVEQSGWCERTRQKDVARAERGAGLPCAETVEKRRCLCPHGDQG